MDDAALASSGEHLKLCADVPALSVLLQFAPLGCFRYTVGVVDEGAHGVLCVGEAHGLLCW